MAKPAARTSKYLRLCGFPLRLNGSFPAETWRRLLGPAYARGDKPLRAPRLSVELLPYRYVPQKAAGGVPADEMLLGEHLALHYSSRTLYVMLPKDASSGRERWARAALFALSLAAEVDGPATVACTGSGGQAPIHLHCSAVATPRGALVFCGHSTFGKTTIAEKLLRDYPLIEFDLGLLLAGPAQGRARAPRVLFMERYLRRGFGTDAGRGTHPWALPLRGWFWLKKDTHFALRNLSADSPGQAAAGLLPPLLNASRPQAALHRMALLRSLLQTTPLMELSFRKERAPLVKFLRQHGYL